MDRSRFTEQATGDFPRKDWAFVPALPPKWVFPAELWPQLVDAKEALGTLNGIGRTLPDPQLLLRPLQDREALRSSSLEGTLVRPEQLLLYELNPREPHSERDAASDWREVSNYGVALRRGDELLKQMPLCLRVVREMHSILMKGTRGRNRLPGEFRKTQVQIGSDGRFIPPPPNHLGHCLDQLEKYMNADDTAFDPLVRCFLIHYQFEAIHPFMDGNGRVGRALLALMIYRWCNHAMPWLYMSAFYERFKDEYFANLFRVSTEGAWTKWIEFCLRGTIWQARDSIRRCEILSQLREQFHARIGTGSSRTYPIIESLFGFPLVTIPEIAEQHGTSYHTAKADVVRLINAGILRELPDSRPKAFYAPEIMEVAFEEPDDLS